MVNPECIYQHIQNARGNLYRYLRGQKQGKNATAPTVGGARVSIDQGTAIAESKMF